MELEISLPYSQKLAIEPKPKQVNFIHHIYTIILQDPL